MSSGKDFLNRVTKVLTNDLQRWEWASEQVETIDYWGIAVQFLGTRQCVRILQSKNTGEFRVANEIGSSGTTHRLEGLLNGKVRDKDGNMVERSRPEIPARGPGERRFAYAFEDGDLSGLYASKSEAAFYAVQDATQGETRFTVHTLEYWAASDDWAEVDGVEPDQFRIEDGKFVQVIEAAC